MTGHHEKTTNGQRRPRGSKRRRPSGAWELRPNLGLDPATGKRIPRAFTFGNSETTEAEAERELTRLQAAADEGRFRGSAMTLGQLLDRWYAIGEASWSPKVAHEYRRLIDRDLVPALGKIQLRRLRAAHLTDYYTALQRPGPGRKKGLAPNSIERRHAVIRAALNLAVEEELLDKNPAQSKGAKRPPIPGAAVEAPVETDDVQRLVAIAESIDVEVATFFFVAATTGMRRGEVCALRWSVVDLERAVVEVRRSIYDVPRMAPGEKATKTERSRRRVRLDQPTVIALQWHRDWQEKRARDAGMTVTPSSYVFSPEPDGSRPWRPGRMTDRFRALRAKAGVDARLQDLRHYCATLLAARGVPVADISYRLGHTLISTTQNMYTHVLEGHDERVAEVMGKEFVELERRSKVLEDGQRFMFGSGDAKEPPAIEAGGSEDSEEP